MTILGFVESAVLFAQQDAGPPWWIFPFFGIIGLVVIGLGVMNIKTRTVSANAKQKALLSLFGVKDLSGNAAVIVGWCKCAAGGLALIAAVTGPFWAGSLADDNTPGGQQAQAPTPPQKAPNRQTPDRARPNPGGNQQLGQTNNHDAPGEKPEDKPAEPVRLVAGSERGESFAEKAPEGGLLVGLRCAKGKNWGGAIRAVQPIYQVGSDYAIGRRHGGAGGEEHQIVAKPGYAVGAMNARSGAALNALQLVFFRIDGTRLDPDDSYESEWIGCDGGGLTELDPDGAPVVGLFGSCGEEPVAIGIQQAEELPQPVPTVTAELPDAFSQPRPSSIVGDAKGDAFDDIAPEGGILVGLRAFCEKEDGRKLTVRSTQPIYLVGEDYADGQRHGKGGSIEMVALARPGFAVGAIQHNAFFSTVGLRLVFMKITPNGLSSDYTYESKWLGYRFDNPKAEAKAEPRFAAGIVGNSDKSISGIGLMVVSPKWAILAAAPPAVPAELKDVVMELSQEGEVNKSGNTFSDYAPEGGVLVGLRCVKGTNWGGALKAVQPVYQVGNGYALGKRHGAPGGKNEQLLAKPGYAVGAVNTRAGLVLNAVQLVYFCIDGERLDPDDCYESDWVGCDGGGLAELDCDGSPIVGILGSWQEDLTSMAIQPTLALWEPIPLATAPQPTASQSVVKPPKPAETFRTWRSSNGTFSLEAKMIGLTPEGVKLENRHGKVVTVPLDKLSEEDAAYIRSRKG